MSLPNDALLPIFRVVPIGTTIAETDCFDEGDGIKVTLTATEVVVEVRADDKEGALGIPITTLLEAIEEYNERYGS